MIKINNLSFSYPGYKVFEDAYLQINPGEFVGIHGANGSGKSTLFNLILGFLKADQGDIYLLDQDAKNFNNYHKIGYVSQIGLDNFKSFPSTSVELVMSKSKKMNGKAKEDALHSLDHLNSLDLADRKISSLSGGQMQRVLLAREIMYDPKILFLDEPTSGLDESSIDRLKDILEHLHKEHKMTIVMITHHDFVTTDRKIVVNDKKLIEVDKYVSI